MKRVYAAAQMEVQAQWTLALGGAEGGMFVRRAKAGTTREVLKYSISPEALTKSPLPVGPAIEAMKGCRMVTSWGSVRKAAKEVKAEMEAAAAPMMCECGNSGWTLPPRLEQHTRPTRLQCHPVHGWR